jgi:acetyl-CoA carboxylase carboxyl transferase subunit alpha
MSDKQFRSNYTPLDFEKPVYELEKQIEKLREKAGRDGKETRDEIARLTWELRRKVIEVYYNTDAWSLTQISRHPDRPHCTDYIPVLFDKFFQIHGDRCYGDDPSVMAGIGWIVDDETGEARRIAFIGHEKGRRTRGKMERNFGMTHPEGYRKAQRLMRIAEKFKLPLICLVDTPGAFPGVGAEDRGQAEAISITIGLMLSLKTPTVSVIIGEGGSGGALALAAADKLMMMRYSTFSVMSPEGCASILWRSSDMADKAAAALKMSSDENFFFRVIDGIVPEPKGGAHRDPQQAAKYLKKSILGNLVKVEREFSVSPDAVLEKRFDKFRRMGYYGGV